MNLQKPLTTEPARTRLQFQCHAEQLCQSAASWFFTFNRKAHFSFESSVRPFSRITSVSCFLQSIPDFKLPPTHRAVFGVQGPFPEYIITPLQAFLHSFSEVQAYSSLSPLLVFCYTHQFASMEVPNPNTTNTSPTHDPLTQESRNKEICRFLMVANNY